MGNTQNSVLMNNEHSTRRSKITHSTAIDYLISWFIRTNYNDKDKNIPIDIINEFHKYIGDAFKDTDDDIIEIMEKGTTLLKYGKNGKPKFLWFNITADHKYLMWWEKCKDFRENCRIQITHIRKILLNTDSEIINKTKQKDLYNSSFTIYFGWSAVAEIYWKQFTVTTKNEKECIIWSNGLKILSHSLRKDLDLRTLKQSEANQMLIDYMFLSDYIILSIQSTFKVFSKYKSLLEYQNNLMKKLKKCVAITNKNVTNKHINNEHIKSLTVNIQHRLQKVKREINSSDISRNENLTIKLCLCEADLIALKEKLLAIIHDK